MIENALTYSVIVNVVAVPALVGLGVHHYHTTKEVEQ